MKKIYAAALCAASILTLTACGDSTDSAGPSWPTANDLEAAAPEGRTMTPEEYRWLTFAACGAYATFGSYHYVIPEALNGAGRDNQKVLMAGLVKVRDGSAADSNAPSMVMAGVDWPGGLAEWSKGERHSAISSVTVRQCPELEKQVSGRLFGAGRR